MATFEPLVKTVTVPLPIAAAFDLFTTGISSWWPLGEHSVEKDRAELCVFEQGVGGRIFERATDGTEHDWGRVTEWDPPRRVVCTWHPGRDESTAQRVEVEFSSIEGGTSVVLTHRGWETLGDSAAAHRADYDGGWDFVLGHFVTGGKD